MRIILDKYDEMCEMIDVACEQAGHPLKRVIYSAWEGDINNPINNLHDIAASGRVRFRQHRNTFFGGPNSKDYASNEVLVDPTWLTVARLANDMILTTLNDHHVFLEGIEFIEYGPDGVKVYEFLMGS